MKSDGHRVCTMSSDLSKEEQLQQLEEFLNGKASVLIATDMLSRGIDIPQVCILSIFKISTFHFQIVFFACDKYTCQLTKGYVSSFLTSNFVYL